MMIIFKQCLFYIFEFGFFFKLILDKRNQLVKLDDVKILEI